MFKEATLGSSCSILPAASMAVALLVTPCVAGAAVSVPPPVGPNQIAVHEINVDQAAATLVETPCGAILIDAGSRGSFGSNHLLEYLKAFFDARPGLNKTLAAVYLSHPHVDHNRMMMKVESRYKVGGYVHNGQFHGSGATNAIAMVRKANQRPFPVRAINDQVLASLGTNGYTDSVVDPLNCPGVDPKIVVLAGAYTDRTKAPFSSWSADDWGDENNHSLAVRIDFGQASFLFLGDMEIVAQKVLLERYEASGRLKAGVYHASHHGARNGTDTDTVDAIQPKYALIGVGPSWVSGEYTAQQHGHPHRNAINALLAGPLAAQPTTSRQVGRGQYAFEPKDIDKAIYATGWNGDIVITADDQGAYAVVTAK